MAESQARRGLLGAAATVAPVPLATGSWGTLLSGWPLTVSPVIVPRDVSECTWCGVWGGREGKDVTEPESREVCLGAGSVWPSAEASQGASPSPSPQDFPPPAAGGTQEVS